MRTDKNFSITHTSFPTRVNFSPASLFYRTSYEEWVQPTGAHDAYHYGDIRTHKGKTWRSTADNNTWEPGVYGWEEVE